MYIKTQKYEIRINHAKVGYHEYKKHVFWPIFYQQVLLRGLPTREAKTEILKLKITKILLLRLISIKARKIINIFFINIVSHEKK